MMSELKNKMYNYEVPAPEGVWESIEAELGHTAKVFNLESGVKRSNFSMIMVAAAIILLVFVSIFFNLTPSPTQQNMSLADNRNISTEHVYVTIAGPDGNNVKVSKKVAAKIISNRNTADEQWNRKIAKWKNTMMTATTTNFLDVMDVAKND